MMSRLNIKLQLLLLALALFTSPSMAWTSGSRFAALRTRGIRTATPQTPRFVDVTTNESRKRFSLPLQLHQKPLQHKKRWIRPLTRLAGFCLVLTSLLASPQTAMASEMAAAPLILPQTLPTPVPRIVELQLTLRLLFASLLGAAVGQERSSTHKHSAGVRTMALVALGACAFTICSSFGFTAVGGGRCDPSRMASNVASGVGFVGAGVITTHSINTDSSNPKDSRQSIVHGLTTATAIWISAAIGVSCGVGMFYIASAATLSTITILRFGRVKKKFRTPSNTGDFFYTDPAPWTRAPSNHLDLKSKTPSLEEMNEDDEWDSHVESLENEEEEEETAEPEQEVLSILPDEELVREADRDVAEFHISGQAALLEQAHMAARSKNLTELVTNQQQHSHPRNQSTATATEDYLGRLQPRTTLSARGRSNETLAP